MLGTAGKYFFGENFWGPNIAMISGSCPKNKIGNYVSAQQFYNILAGCAATLLFGQLVNVFNCAGNAVAIGRILAGFCSVGYLGSIFAWWKAGKYFEKAQIKEGNTLATE